MTGTLVRAKGLARLSGETVRLRPVEEGDLPLLVRWMNDAEVRYWLHHSERPDATVETVRERFGLAGDGLPNLVWMIETLRVLPQTQPPTQGRLLRVLPDDPSHSGQAEGRPVGHVDLVQVDPHHHRAELAIAIGEKECWDRGYGTDAIRAVLRPVQTNFLFFVARPDGSHAFATTLEEHQRNVEQYQGESQ